MFYLWLAGDIEKIYARIKSLLFSRSFILMCFNLVSFNYNHHYKRLFFTEQTFEVGFCLKYLYLHIMFFLCVSIPVRRWMISGVNFINAFTKSFYERANPKSAKKTVKLTVFFALLGLSHSKAAHRTLMKLTPGVPSNV